MPFEEFASFLTPHKHYEIKFYDLSSTFIVLNVDLSLKILGLTAHSVANIFFFNLFILYLLLKITIDLEKKSQV